MSPKDLVVQFEYTVNEIGELNSEGRRTYALITPFETVAMDGQPGGVKGEAYAEGEYWSDTEVERRYRIIFNGGGMRPAEGQDLRVWRTLFEEERKGLRVRDRVRGLLLRLMMGYNEKDELKMDANGVKSYEFKRSPLGFFDILYQDEDMRISKGNRGTVTVVQRGKPDPAAASPVLAEGEEQP
ncbi:unnamed protein product [Chrysoparadoxa australica]